MIDRPRITRGETLTSTAFDLPTRLAAKAAPELIGDDEEHFAAIDASIARTVAETSARLDDVRRQPGGHGQQALDRDLEVHRLTGLLRTMGRFGLDLCLGRTVGDGIGDDDLGQAADSPTYIGRAGLTDDAGRRLLVDWRSPVAEPFFGATHGDPMGLASRRRYRWANGRVTDYWDEVFTTDGLEGRVALDDQSAFIASLGGSRSPRMRDVLSTIQADQDAIIRAGSRGALVVDGGPGTGKTVVALHRTAYLLYSDPRLGHRRGGVLFVGPHQPYLDYVADVLPSLGEEGVATCTLRDLVPEGASAGVEPDVEVARLKSSAQIVRAIEAAVRHYEAPPTRGLMVETPWAEVWLDPADWAEAFDAPEAGTPHNDGRGQVWEALIGILADSHDEIDDAVTDAMVRRALQQNAELRTIFNRAWPLLDAAGVVGDLWTVPAYLRACAPWLEPAEIEVLQRADPTAWTISDLPLLDAARQRIGDPEASARRRRREAEAVSEREQMGTVIDHLVDAMELDDGEGLMTMLRGDDVRRTLLEHTTAPPADPDALAGPFAHIVVDEAQELTDAEWQMLLLRCPSRSFTIVGDRAQARHGFTESWTERLARVGVERVTIASLSVNYRTPEEVMAAAEPVIRAVLPDANVPTSVRRSGVPVAHGRISELDAVLERWLDEHDDGLACVISVAGGTEGQGRPGRADAAGGRASTSPRVRRLTPELAKGLEFDLVVLVDPDRFGVGIEGAVDRYVAMTRATQQLVVLTSDRPAGDRPASS
ncbi:RNA polymerase recycling motor ATPase HelR [Agromyces aureus]|uniref:AAA family ATPase n=1 Tax=Agromyces aureus TaxID=453304 RepID=A0A191WE99_9MICO|nr:RNA polymerase recycling motor ATPase HelR [Agromyces aureus]ANJ26596.1 AAA family ATPase [Agromyces aureus]